MSAKKFSRRDFLRLASVSVAGGVLASCKPTQGEQVPEEQPESMPQAEEGALIRYWTGWGGDWSGKTWEGLIATDTFKEMFSEGQVEIKGGVPYEAFLTAIAGGEPPDGASNDHFGISVSIDGEYAIVGAYGDDDNGEGSGSVHMFALCPDSDLTGDCFVDFGDFSVLGDAWFTDPNMPNWDPACDISEPNDNVIDGLDLGVFVGNWLEGL